jgi:hypothetical protein
LLGVSVSLFAFMIHFEICVTGIPVFSESCSAEVFAKSETVFTPANSNSSALFWFIPSISVNSDVLAVS